MPKTVNGEAVLQFPAGVTQLGARRAHLRVPALEGEPRVWRQPGVSELGVVLYSQLCG